MWIIRTWFWKIKAEIQWKSSCWSCFYFRNFTWISSFCFCVFWKMKTDFSMYMMNTRYFCFCETRKAHDSNERIVFWNFEVIRNRSQKKFIMMLDLLTYWCELVRMKNKKISWNYKNRKTCENILILFLFLWKEKWKSSILSFHHFC